MRADRRDRERNDEMSKARTFAVLGVLALGMLCVGLTACSNCCGCDPCASPCDPCAGAVAAPGGASCGGGAAPAEGGGGAACGAGGKSCG